MSINLTKRFIVVLYVCLGMGMGCQQASWDTPSNPITAPWEWNHIPLPSSPTSDPTSEQRCEAMALCAAQCPIEQDTCLQQCTEKNNTTYYSQILPLFRCAWLFECNNSGCLLFQCGPEVEQCSDVLTTESSGNEKP